MKKSLLKILVVALAAASITGFTVMEAFAANTTVDTWTVIDSAVTASINKTITVKNISKSDNPTVTAYQIIKGTYKDNKLTDYVLCDGLGSLQIADKTKPTEKEITDIAAAIRADTTSLTGIKMTRGTEGSSTVDYTADVEPGLYIVIVTGSTQAIVYNPAVVAVNISDANNIAGAQGGSVDMTKYFKVGDNEVYLKSNKVSVDKSIVTTNEEGESIKSNGGTVAYGDTVNFKIDEMTIPSYSAEYTNPKYTITDTLEKTAFSGIQNLTVKVDGTEVAPDTTTYSLVCKDKNGGNVSPSTTGSKSSAENATTFTVEFTKDFIKANGGKSVVIEYSTKVADTAGYNYSENQNTAKVDYSNTPSTTGSVQDTTYHYTFGISANIDAEDDNIDNDKNKSKETTNEINKVSDADGTYTEGTDSSGNNIKKNTKALPGAEFTLYTNIDFAETHKVGTTESDEYGRVSFTGLNAGIYYLKETKAPANYTINPTVYRIEITPTIGDDGVMTSYSINTYVADERGEKSGSAVGSATYTNTGYTVNADGSVTNNITIDNSNTPLAIVDTKLATLPSTGGVGTIVITVGASLGMAAFLTIYIWNKKKNKNAD